MTLDPRPAPAGASDPLEQPIDIQRDVLRRGDCFTRPNQTQAHAHRRGVTIQRAEGWTVASRIGRTRRSGKAEPERLRMEGSAKGTMARSSVFLESVRIDGFRSCDGTAFAPHPQLSVLIGPNGAGKTNVLQGIAMLAASSALGTTEALPAQGRSEDDARVTAAFKTGSETITLHSTVRFSDRDEGGAAVFASKDEWRAGDQPNASARGWVEVPLAFLSEQPVGARKAVRLAIPGLPLYMEPTEPLVQFLGQYPAALTAVAAFRQRVRYYSASQFTDPSQYPTGLEINQDGALVGPATAGRAQRQFLFELYQLQSTHPARFAAYLDLVGPQGLGLLSSLRWKTVSLSSSLVAARAHRPRSSRRRERSLVIPTVLRGTERLSFNQLSEGTLRALAVVFYVMSGHSDLLLLEEPEVGVHRELLVSLLELIRSQSQRQQILISTHSDFVLDFVQPENVFAVKRTTRGKTTVRGLTQGTSAKELTVLREYLRTEGSLGEYWRTFGLDS